MGRGRRRSRSPSTRRLRPKAQTTVAPVGRSSTAEATIARMLTPAPKIQPTARRGPMREASRMPASAGTIRYEKTSSTPAMRTDEVTTTPKEA